MKGINHCTFLGNLARDAEVKFTNNGNRVANFTIGCSYSIKDQNAPNGWRESTEWIKVCCWSPSDWLCKQLRKGKPLHVTGRMQTRSWENNGEKRYMTEINAQPSNVIPVQPISAANLDNQSAQQQQPPPQQQQQAPAAAPPAPPPPQQQYSQDQYPGADSSPVTPPTPANQAAQNWADKPIDDNDDVPF